MGKDNVVAFEKLREVQDPLTELLRSGAQQ
jgi:hypothetical protein